MVRLTKLILCLLVISFLTYQGKGYGIGYNRDNQNYDQTPYSERYGEFIQNSINQNGRNSVQRQYATKGIQMPRVQISKETNEKDLVQSPTGSSATVNVETPMKKSNNKEDYASTDSDTNSYYQAQGVMIVLFVMTIFILIKFFGSLNWVSNKLRSESYEKKAYYSLLKDICFMVSIMLVILIIHYYEGFNAFDNKIDNVLYGMFFFILFWMIFGYFSMKNSFKMIRKLTEWDKLSCDVSKLNELKREYENQYYSEPQKIDKELKAKISYIFMKQSFINPIELPIITESFLRRDFNFALYLGYCISDFMSELFSFGFQSYINILLLITLWKLLSGFGVLFQSILMILYPFISLITLYLQKRQFNRVYNSLVPKVDQPENINFQIDMDIRDPFDHYDTMQFPPYMEQTINENKGEDSDEASDNEEEYSVKSRNKSKKSKVESIHKSDNYENDSIILDDVEEKKDNLFKSPETFLTYRQNRHERLFSFGKLGIMLHKLSLQSFFLQMIIWAAHFVENKYSSCPILKNCVDGYYISNIDAIDYSIMTFSLIVGFVTVLFIFPSVCFQFTVVTHIQMMKRRDIIEETIKEQRNQRSQRSFRIRELIQYFKQDISDKALRPFTKKLVEENFSLCQSKDKDNLDVMNLAEFFPLCGSELKKLENFILLKKAQSQGESIKFKDLLIAIEQTTNDVKVDPFEVVKSIFILIMKNKQKLSITDIKQFFSVYDGYFEREDVQDFINELISIQRDGSLIDVQEIASLIRDDIECFPR